MLPILPGTFVQIIISRQYWKRFMLKKYFWDSVHVHSHTPGFNFDVSMKPKAAQAC
jgi:hypothetical protein